MYCFLLRYVEFSGSCRCASTCTSTADWGCPQHPQRNLALRGGHVRHEPTKTTCQYLPSLAEGAGSLRASPVHIGSLLGKAEVPGTKTSTPGKVLLHKKRGLLKVYFGPQSENRFSG